MKLINVFLLCVLFSSAVNAQDLNCKKKLEIAEGVIVECNDKVKELDGHIKILSLRIKEQEQFIKQQESYVDELEAYAKANDAQSWWHRNKLLLGFIGGILLTTGVIVGVGQVVK